MKKIIFKLCSVVFVIALLSSCAFHNGYMCSSASLSSANFSYVKQNIRGDATITYILGIGGTSQLTLVDNAKQKMLADYPLKSNQTLANLTVNFKKSYFLGIVTTITCIVTADIVEFNNGQLNLSEKNQNTLEYNNNSNIKTKEQNSTEKQTKITNTISPIFGTLIDSRDGKTYRTVKIGTQIWMAENLAYKASTGCWFYDNNDSNLTTYGYLYNWETAKTVCPPGWHLPTDAEWKVLIDVLNEKNKAGTKLKSSNGWKDYKVKNINDINSSGFSALPGGYRRSDGSFLGLKTCGYWWSSSEKNTTSALRRIMVYDESSVSVLSDDKINGYSVRCIKD